MTTRCKTESCSRPAAFDQNGFCFSCNEGNKAKVQAEKKRTDGDVIKEVEKYDRGAFRARNFGELWSEMARKR